MTSASRSPSPLHPPDSVFRIPRILRSAPTYSVYSASESAVVCRKRGRDRRGAFGVDDVGDVEADIPEFVRQQ